VLLGCTRAPEKALCAAAAAVALLPLSPPVFGAFLCLTAGRGAQETPGYRGEAAPLPHPARRTRGGPARAFSANRRRRSPSPPSRGGEGEDGGSGERRARAEKVRYITVFFPPFFSLLPPLLVRMDKKNLMARQGKGLFSVSQKIV